jgi:hypothetical protein
MTSLLLLFGSVNRKSHAMSGRADCRRNIGRRHRQGQNKDGQIVSGAV